VGAFPIESVDWAPSFAFRAVNALPISYEGVQVTVASPS
jgi:hypothetical protein